MASRMTVSAALRSLSAKNVGEILVPVLSPREIDVAARLVVASEEAYTSAIEGARLRRESLRDAVIYEAAHVAKFWLDPVRLQEAGGLRCHEIRRVEQIAKENQTSFLEAWNERFNC